MIAGAPLATVSLRDHEAQLEATFVPAAGMVCSSLRHRGDELLAQNAGVGAYAERGKTMGIPLLYPWANRLARFGYEVAGRQVTLSEEDPRIPRDDAGLPIHGVSPGLLRWEVDGAGAPDAVEATLRWHSDELLALFPFVHEVRVVATVARAELTLATTVVAAADGRVPVSFGYHPYTCVPGGRRDDWLLTLGAANRLVLDDHSIPTGERAPIDRAAFRLGSASLDDAFDAAPEPATFEAAAADATLTVELLTGYSYAQVFAPGGQEFVCFEPMTAPTNALNSGDGVTIVEPGGSYRAAFRIALSRGA